MEEGSVGMADAQVLKLLGDLHESLAEIRDLLAEIKLAVVNIELSGD